MMNTLPDKLLFESIQLALFFSPETIFKSVTMANDLSIEFSEIFTPPLTTIDMPKYRLGKRAVELLVKYINTLPEERIYRQLIIEPVLAVRKTT